MSDPILAVSDVSKRYRIYFEKPSLLRSVLPALFGAGTYRDFWALRDISLSAARGECLGIIGANGSGIKNVKIELKRTLDNFYWDHLASTWTVAVAQSTAKTRPRPNITGTAPSSPEATRRRMRRRLPGATMRPSAITPSVFCSACPTRYASPACRSAASFSVVAQFLVVTARPAFPSSALAAWHSRMPRAQRR